MRRVSACALGGTLTVYATIWAGTAAFADDSPAPVRLDPDKIARLGLTAIGDRRCRTSCATCCPGRRRGCGRCAAPGRTGRRRRWGRCLPCTRRCRCSTSRRRSRRACCHACRGGPSSRRTRSRARRPAGASRSSHSCPRPRSPAPGRPRPATSRRRWQWRCGTDRGGPSPRGRRS